MNYLLLLFMIILFAVQTIDFKEFNRVYMKNPASYFLFNFLYFCIVVLIFVATKAGRYSFHPYTLLIGACFGVLFTIAMYCYLKAMEAGPLSYTTLLFSMGLIIPVIFGLLFWNEKISMYQIAGLMLLSVTFYIGSASAGGGGRKINLKWLILSFFAFLGNGVLMSMGKLHQVIMPGREINEYLIIAFGVAALFSLAGFVFFKSYGGQAVTHLKSVRF